jgi:hypothetical protein
MSCLIKGCNFLLKNISDEAFVYQRHGNPEYKFQTADPNIFPYLLVNIGSGVSIMKVIFMRFMMMFWQCIIQSIHIYPEDKFAGSRRQTCTVNFHSAVKPQ